MHIILANVKIGRRRKLGDQVINWAVVVLAMHAVRKRARARASVCLWFVMGVMMIFAVFVWHNINAIDYVIDLFWVSWLGMKKRRFHPRPAHAPLMD